MLNSSKVCFLEDNIDSLYRTVEDLNSIIRPGCRVLIIKGPYYSKGSPHLRRASWWKRRKRKDGKVRGSVLLYCLEVVVVILYRIACGLRVL